MYPYSQNHYHLDIKFDNLEDFYKECLKIEDTGDAHYHNSIFKEDSPRFRGLSLKEINESKYSYPKGLEKLKELEEEIEILAGSNFDYKWDEIDGDDMDMERLYESSPSLRKRFRTDGAKNGKFINIYVNISENAFCSSENLLYKCLSTVAITDYLENKGYKVAVFVALADRQVGSYKGQWMNTTYTEIKVKDYQEPLIKASLITSISPWFFRYWTFLLFCAKFKVSAGLGQSARLNKVSDNENIYIDQGECFNKEAVIRKIKEINKIFQ